MALISNGTSIVSGGGLASGIGGKVLQIVQYQETAFPSFALNTGSTTALTGFSLNITPSSTANKVLIMYHVHLGLTNNTAQPYIILQKNGSDLWKGNSNGSRQQSTTSHGYDNSTSIHLNSTSYLDSPSTTSQITYRLITGGCCGRTYNMNVARDNNSEYMTTASSMQLMEIAG